MPYVVVVADRIAPAGFELLRAAPELEVISTADKREHLDRELERANALIVRSETMVTDQLIDRAAQLTVIARAGIGVDNIDVDAATRRGIAVLNAPGANTVSAAEHTIALLLALLRRVPWAAASMQAGDWERRRFAGTELRGKTLGVIGVGRIGANVAQIARAFGMQILGHDPYLPESRAKELRTELLPMDELLRKADVVSLHLPLTDDTRHLLNGERLALMKPGAVIINTARGALVDETALLQALEAGHIAGAALDVFDPEPLAADSPLRRCENVILTPHLAASTPEAQERVAREICEAVRDALLTGSVGGAVNLPGISREVLVRLASVLDMARRLGRLAAAISGGRVESVEVSYGGGDDAAPRPTMLAAVEGVLSAIGVGPVTLVNAAVLAGQRGMSVERHVGSPESGFETTVGVSVRSEEQTVTVVGASIGERGGRVIRINDFAVDVPASGHVVVLRNRDVPGVIGRVGTLLGAARINIASYHQSRLEPAGTDALAAIVVDQVPGSTILEQLAAIPDVLDVKSASLDGK